MKSKLNKPDFSRFGFMKIIAESIHLIIKEPKITVFIFMGILCNTIIFLIFYFSLLSPLFPLYSKKQAFIQIDPNISNLGDFLKLFLLKKIPLSLFIIEIMRNICFFFVSTVTIVLLGKNLKRIFQHLNTHSRIFLSLSIDTLHTIAIWSFLYHIIFLLCTFGLDIIFKAIPQIHQLYYSISYSICSLLVFYINPIIAFEKKPLPDIVKRLMHILNETKKINIIWIFITTLWFYFLGTPRTQINISSLTLFTTIVLFVKTFISPVAAVLWYWSIEEAPKENCD